MMSRLALIAALALVGGCIRHTFLCSDGSECDLGDTCLPMGGCESGSLEACRGKNEGDACGGGRTCVGGMCLDTARCGDGHVDPGEECDDATSSRTGPCLPECVFNPCGNGMLDPGEQCDLGAANSQAPDARCRITCMMQGCGDRVVDTGEACDGSLSPTGDCLPGCVLPRCGDGTVQLARGEVCDDGNVLDGDDCSADCRISTFCGNTVIDAVKGEECDDGNHTNGDGCQASCMLPRCGDHIVDATEFCDDGNTVGDDGCAKDCNGPN